MSAMLLLGLLSPMHARAAPGDEREEIRRDDIRLELSPRICTLTSKDTQCDTVVRATWRSPRDESLCLIIAGRPDVKRCWEKYSEGSYSIEIFFPPIRCFSSRTSTCSKCSPPRYCV